jgi:hypothetical protein
MTLSLEEHVLRPTDEQLIVMRAWHARRGADDPVHGRVVLVIDELLERRAAIAAVREYGEEALSCMIAKTDQTTQISVLREAPMGVISYAECYTDDGSYDEGYQSPELRSTLSNARAALDGENRVAGYIADYSEPNIAAWRASDQVLKQLLSSSVSLASIRESERAACEAMLREMAEHAEKHDTLGSCGGARQNQFAMAYDKSADAIAARGK